MLNVIVNGIQENIVESKYKNFEEFLKDYRKEGMVISQLLINDKEIPMPQIEKLYGAHFEGGEKIELKCQTIQTYSSNLIDEVLGYISNLQKALPKTANLIMSDENKALLNIQELQEGLSALENMKQNLYKITATTDKDYSDLDDFKEDLLDTLKDVNIAMQNKNSLEMADLLEYDLPDKLDYYVKLFEKIKKLLDL